MQVNKKLLSYLLVWIFSANTVLSPIITFTHADGLASLDNLLNDGAFSEIKGNLSIWNTILRKN